MYQSYISHLEVAIQTKQFIPCLMSNVVREVVKLIKLQWKVLSACLSVMVRVRNKEGVPRGEPIICATSPWSVRPLWRSLPFPH